MPSLRCRRSTTPWVARRAAVALAAGVGATLALAACATVPALPPVPDPPPPQSQAPAVPSSTPTSSAPSTSGVPTSVPTAPAPSAPPATTPPGSGCRQGALTDAQREVVSATTSFILSATGPAGSIRQHPDADRIDPYLGSYAAMGLARAGAVTCDRATLDAAWGYVGWYASAMDPDGFVDDQRTAGAVTVGLGERDSTDAYAGMFLVALAEVWRADPDPARLGPLLPSVDAARRAIAATHGPDGLTRATPEWPVAYLMDQAEVHAGLLSAAEVYAAAGRPGDAAAARQEAAVVRSAVDGLWDPTSGGYRWAVHEDGTEVGVDWGHAYPDVASQAFAAAWGLVPADRLDALTTRVEAALPWRDPGALAAVEGRREPVGWWPVAAWSGARSGQADAVTASLALVRSADATGRAWPYNVGVAGQLTVAATGGWSPTVVDG